MVTTSYSFFGCSRRKLLSFALTLSMAALTLVGCSSVTVSPDTELHVAVSYDSENHIPATMSIIAQGDTLLSHIDLGLVTTNRTFDKLKLVHVSENEFGKEDYRMVQGKRLHCFNEYNAREYTFVNPEGDTLRLQMKVFPDGVAFRYVIPYTTDNDTILRELTTYKLADGTRRWIQPFKLDYEGMFPLATDGNDVAEKQNGHWGYPALAQPTDSMFVLITDSDIRKGHSASSLSNSENRTQYNVVYGPGEQIIGTQGWTTPWRVVITGDLPKVVESTLVTDVATPAVTEQTDWIKPGISSWNYWSNNHGTRDYQVVKAFTDLAVDMNWPYTLLDWEWDTMKNGGNFFDAVKYIHGKGIQPLMWYNSSETWVGEGGPTPQYRLNKHADRIKEYQWLDSIGIKGLKIDFFNGDAQKTMDYCIDILEDAIPYHLLITFHGATIPRGWQRTYPNLMTVEGVYGAEWYNNNGYMTDHAAAHNATLPFTRNVIGPMDYTPGTFTDSQHPHITTYAHELALPILFESPILHMPDRPEAYYTLPQDIKAMLSSLPTVWDDTKLLDGYPGEYVIMARRSGDDWYIAGINGTDDQKTLTADLSRLNLDRHEDIIIFTDSVEPRQFAPTANRKVSDGPIEIKTLPRGGFVALIKGETASN